MPTLTFKVSDEEARQIRALARRQRLSVSEFLRRQAQPVREAPREIPRVVCAYTGATIFGPTPELPALNTESVRGMLADFP
jgi:hypothetical protein